MFVGYFTDGNSWIERAVDSDLSWRISSSSPRDFNPVWLLPGYSWIEEYNDFWTDCPAYEYTACLQQKRRKEDALVPSLSRRTNTWMNVNACQAASSSTICCFTLKGLWSSALCSGCVNYQLVLLPLQGFRQQTFPLFTNLNMCGAFSQKFQLSVIWSSKSWYWELSWDQTWINVWSIKAGMQWFSSSFVRRKIVLMKSILNWT